MEVGYPPRFEETVSCTKLYPIIEKKLYPANSLTNLMPTSTSTCILLWLTQLYSASCRPLVQEKLVLEVQAMDKIKKAQVEVSEYEQEEHPILVCNAIT